MRVKITLACTETGDSISLQKINERTQTDWS